MRISCVKDSSDTLAGDEVCDLPCPATVEAKDVVVPYHAPAAVPHAVDVQHVCVHTSGRFTYDVRTRWRESFKSKGMISKRGSKKFLIFVDVICDWSLESPSNSSSSELVWPD